MFTPEGLHRLISPETPLDEAQSLVVGASFHDPHAAVRRLRRLAATGTNDAVTSCLIRLFTGLADVADADLSLVNFERFITSNPQPAAAWIYLAENPRAIEILLRLFVGSQHLTETLVRHPEYLQELTRHKRLADFKSREEFLSELETAEADDTLAGQWDAVRRYQAREILRIAACDVFGLLEFKAVTLQLSLLADAIVQRCLNVLCPILADQPAVLALGKLGGEELNYSSDIDLIFIAPGPPGPATLLCQRLIRALQETSSEGFCYRVDTRLRPWGRSGELVYAIDAHLDYLHQHAQLWEKQALIKARPIAGDRLLGARFLDEAESAILSTPHDQRRECVRAAKQRIEDQLRRQGRMGGEVKSGRGSIRDIEFVAQYLQWTHREQVPYLRVRGTLEALVRLADCDVLHADEYRQLTDGYVFLRTIEHALQLVHNEQTHALPTDRQELNYLARRLDFRDADQLLQHLESHRNAIRAIYERHLGGAEVPREAGASFLAPPPRELPPYGKTFSPEEQDLHSEILGKISLQQPVRVLTQELEAGAWRVTVLGIDQPGDLAMICGLLFVYGFDIDSGDVFTNCHPKLSKRLPRTRQSPPARDFVNVFIVRPAIPLLPEAWVRYQQDLIELKCLAARAGVEEAQGQLANRVAEALQGGAGLAAQLSPIDIAMHNDAAPKATLVHITGDDSEGFLYELTNGLSLCGLNVERMSIRTEGPQVRDTLLVTDAARGGKLGAARQQEIRTAVVLIKHFTHLLPQASNPEAALLHFRQLVRDLVLQPDGWERLASLERPEVLDALATLLGVSDFLWEDFLRVQHAHLFPVLADVHGLEAAPSRAVYERELAAQLALAHDEAAISETLATFRDREMFRTDMRHILGRLPEFGQFAAELTMLAEVVVAAAVQTASRYCLSATGRTAPATLPPWTVCALGKFGGRELGFASDIELMFVFDADAAHPDQAHWAAWFQHVVETFSLWLRSRREGVFHIDLRLRPYGRAGSLAVSRESFQQYFAAEGPAWPYERQALVKLRPIAGNTAFGQRLLHLRDSLLYGADLSDFAAMRAIREKQVRQLVEPGRWQAKMSPGGLVDIEYLVQTLQLRHGAQATDLRDPNTRLAMAALARHRYLSPEQFQQLDAAYIFERRLIDALRMVRGNANDLTLPPNDSPEFEFLARRLDYAGRAAQLASDVELHSKNTLEVVRHFEAAP